jgi:hypothetical protein
MRKLVLRWEKCTERQGDYVEKYVCQFVAKILYFTSYFHLFKYMVPFSRYITVCINSHPSYIVLLLHFLIHSLTIVTLSETCGCFHICYNTSCVSTGYVLSIAYSITTTGMSHLNNLVNKGCYSFTMFLLCKYSNILIPNLFAKTTSNVINKII